MTTDWQVRTWMREHKTHGTFFVDIRDDGAAAATRLYRDAAGGLRGWSWEDLGDKQPSFALAMKLCEDRIDELDRELEARSLEAGPVVLSALEDARRSVA